MSKQVWVIVLSLFSVVLTAHGVELKAELAQMAKVKEVNNLRDSNLHPAAKFESWFLSGIAENEKAQQFAYYFIVKRRDANFSYFTQVMNLNDEKIIFKQSDKATLTLDTRQGINLKIGKGFLRHNDINDSWTFGVNGQSGFNFRVESLQVNSYKISHLKQLSFYNLQTKRLNGQLSYKGQTEFVTAMNAWIAHQWQAPAQQPPVTMERLLCRSLNNQGITITRAYQGKEIIYSQADFLNSQAESIPISQFSMVSHTHAARWHVKILSPKKQFNVITNSPLGTLEGNKTIHYFLGGIEDKMHQHLSGACLIIQEQDAAA